MIISGDTWVVQDARHVFSWKIHSQFVFTEIKVGITRNLQVNIRASIGWAETDARRGGFNPGIWTGGIHWVSKASVCQNIHKTTWSGGGWCWQNSSFINNKFQMKYLNKAQRKLRNNIPLLGWPYTALTLIWHISVSIFWGWCLFWSILLITDIIVYQWMKKYIEMKRV